MLTFHFPYINVLMYYNIYTYTNLQKGNNKTTSLPISFLKGILRKIYIKNIKSYASKTAEKHNSKI